MHLDDILSSLAFLNRQQLLRFMQANRFTQNIVLKYFNEKPFIYAHLSLKQGHIETYEEIWVNEDEDPLYSRPVERFCLYLNALNCDCEQQLSINGHRTLRTYKSIWEPTNCVCPSISFLGEELECWNAKTNLEKFELNEYNKNCFDQWTKMENPELEIHEYRSRSLIVSGFLENLSSHKFHNCNSFSIWEHPLNNASNLALKWICNEYKFVHRHQINYQGRSCHKLVLRLDSSDFCKMVDHLKAPFLQILKLDLAPYGSYWMDDPAHGHRELTNRELKAYYKSLSWIVENRKITMKSVVLVDFYFLSILFNRLKIKEERQHFLFESIGKCGHLEIINISDRFSNTIHSNINLPSAISLLQKNEVFLKNALFVEVSISVNEPNSEEFILQLMRIHENPNSKQSYRLFLDLNPNNNTCILLLKDFQNSYLPFSYFAIVAGSMKKSDYASINSNQTTGECLRIMPAVIRRHTTENEKMLYFVARYDSTNEEAERIYSSFFTRLEFTVARNQQVWEWWFLNGEKPADEILHPQMTPECVYSFASFLAVIVQATNGQHLLENKKITSTELFNGESTTNIYWDFYPPCESR